MFYFFNMSILNEYNYEKNQDSCKKGCLRASSAPIRSPGSFRSSRPMKSRAAEEIPQGKVREAGSTFFILAIVYFLLIW